MPFSRPLAPYSRRRTRQESASHGLPPHAAHNLHAPTCPHSHVPVRRLSPLVGHLTAPQRKWLTTQRFMEKVHMVETSVYNEWWVGCPGRRRGRAGHLGAGGVVGSRPSASWGRCTWWRAACITNGGLPWAPAGARRAPGWGWGSWLTSQRFMGKVHALESSVYNEWWVAGHGSRQGRGTCAR